MTLSVPQAVTIFIIICTYNRAKHLKGTLDAFSQICIPSSAPAEVIVVDNGSTDGTAALARSCRLPGVSVRYLYEGSRGQCHARNAGVGAARGRVIVFTDDDVRPPADWLSGMCGPILSGSADAVAGGVRIAPHLQRPWMTPMHRMLVASTEGAERLIAMLGANMAFSSAVLGQVPRFDTELGPGRLGVRDDTLFSFQLMRAGYRLSAALDVVFEHRFEEDRLTRESFLSGSLKLGRPLACVAYQWEHGERNFDKAGFPEPVVRLPRLRLARRRLTLSLLRLKDRFSQRSTGIRSEWELRKVEQIAFYLQYLQECRRPPAYDKWGLVKKTLT